MELWRCLALAVLQQHVAMALVLTRPVALLMLTSLTTSWTIGLQRSDATNNV